MSRLDVEIARARENGDKKVSGFTGGVRSLENVAFEVNEEFTFPTTFDVYEQYFGDTGKAQYIWVQIKGTENVKRFYPSTFSKIRTVYNEDGTSTGKRKYTQGTAAEFYRKFATVEEAMRALAGKTVKITKLDPVRTLRYGSTTVITTQIPTIDFVDTPTSDTATSADDTNA